jgi:hypothetical protein
LRDDLSVVVHSFAHAKGALRAAARLKRRVVLASAAGAGSYLGPGWFNALIAAARAEVPEAECTAFLDCDDDVGAALAAIRGEVPGVIFTGRADLARRLAGLAQQHGVRFATVRPESVIDLGEDFFASSEEAERRCAEALARAGGFC